LSDYDAQSICSEKEDIEYFESIIKHTQHYKAVANWMIGPLKHFCKEHDLSMQQFPLSVEKIVDLIQFVESGKVNFNNASGKIMNAMIENKNLSAFEVANELNLIQESDENAIEMWVEETLSSMPEKVKEYKSGKKGLIGLFSGDVKKRSKGKADMQLVQRLLEEKLN
jgi:aspartyl-tRNA(Asn)/glutamyl-tRNA(Gln) amidotransferase subunit B